jgi:hypothetical protein
LALRLKNNRLRDGKTSAPSRTEIDDFITQDVAKQTLSRYLTGTNMNKLKKIGTMDTLEMLVKEVLKICYNNYDLQAIKNLDHLTINCKVPSRSGKNLASKLLL